MGWVGEDNLGDDLIFEAHRRSLGVDLAPLARERLDFGLKMSGRLGLNRHLQMMMFGGGTLIGRIEALRMLEAIEEQLPDLEWTMLGVGVEDPDFRGQRDYYSSNALGDWRRVLSRFPEVLVRGPRSAELLADIGINAEIVGDPVLLFSLPTAPTQNGSEVLTIGVNVCNPEDSWRGGLEKSHDDLARALDPYVAEGARVVIFPFAPSDAGVSTHLATRLGSSASIHVARSFAEFAHRATRCTIFVGERLHSVVCATACLVPSIAIEYRPKLTDFQRSVGAERYVIRSDRTSAGAISEMIAECITRRMTLSGDLFTRVTQLQQVLLHKQQLHAALIKPPYSKSS